MAKIVILDGYTENPGDLSWEGFNKLGRLDVYDRTPQSEVCARIGGANVVLTNKTPIDAAVMERCPNIKYIGVLATGYNVVDVCEAKRRGIAVTNVPSYGTEAVGQFAIAMLLEICCRVGHHSDAVRAGRWSATRDFCFWDYPLIELSGKTMGIIGYGRIGRRTGRIAGSLGMRVLAYDVKKPPLEDGAEFVELNELFSRSDVVSLHCPLFEQTKGIINARTISLMRDGVIILNNSRGALIIESDLAAALNSGKVYAAGLDVVSVEPIVPDNPLLSAKNCLITPHISWAAKESRKRLMDIAVTNLAKFLEGKPVNIVNT